MKPFYISLKPFLDYRCLSRPTQWSEIFLNDKPIEVEIGFGNGEYLARLAETRTDVNFVGFEEYCERIHKTLRKLSRVPNSHVRVIRMDVRPAFEYLFPEGSISYIHCLYPPPWPKKSDAKHRLFTPDFLKLVNSRLTPQGKMKIVTDHYPYVVWIQEQFEGTGLTFDLRRIAATYDTKFERKWVEGGQKEFYEFIVSKEKPVSVPPKKEAELKHYLLDHFDPEQFELKEYSEQGIAVIFKDLLYDSAKKTALIHVLVNDEHIFQNIRLIITHTPQGWRINLAEGTMHMPTAGVAKAIDLVYEAALASGQVKQKS